jgi:hypothetical protein
MEGRNTFSSAEAELIRFLLREKSRALRSAQKSLRSKLRRLGFYISDYDSSQDGFSDVDFNNLVSAGRITITDGDSGSVDAPVAIVKHEIAHKDESYVLDLCDEVLGIQGTRQYRFAFLRGDAGTTLPVDAYYEPLKLVVEYRERQHTEGVVLFDKPDRMTVSGVHRGEQRMLYDERRRSELPKNGIELVEFSYSDFAYNSRKRILRHRVADLAVIRFRLSNYIEV